MLETMRNNATVTEATSPDSIPWLIQKFKVIEGEGEIDLANTPLVRFSIAPEFHDLQLSARAKNATAPQIVSLEDVRLLSRGDKPDEVGRIGRIELKFTQQGALNLNLDELTIRRPSFQIMPGAMNAGGAPPVRGQPTDRHPQPRLRLVSLICALVS